MVISFSLLDRSERKVQQLLWSRSPSLVLSLFFYLVPWCIFSELRMDCGGKSAIYRDATWKMPPLILMTLKHTTHPQDHERDALFQYVGAWDLLKHNYHPYTIWPERLFSQSLQPPETLLAEFLDTGLSAGAAGWGRGWRGLGQSRCRHIILPLQGLHNPLEASLLLSEIMLHTGEERKREQLKGKEGARFRGWVVSHQVKFIYIAHFSLKEIRCGGREREREGDEQRNVRTSGGLLGRKGD